MNEYIDVRGAVPIYFKGSESIRLVNHNRDVTIEQAREEFENDKKNYKSGRND